MKILSKRKPYVSKEEILNGQIRPEVVSIETDTIRLLNPSAEDLTFKYQLLINLLNNKQHDLLERCKLLKNDIIEWSTADTRTKETLESFKTRVENNLFLRSDTDSYFKSDVKTFFKDENLELDNFTNLEIDKENSCVQLATQVGKKPLPNSEYTVSINKLTQNDLDRVLPTKGSDLNYIKFNNETAWTGMVTRSSPKNVTIMFSIKLNKPTFINIMNLRLDNTSGNQLISILKIKNKDQGASILENQPANIYNNITINDTVTEIRVSLTKTFYDLTNSDNTYSYLFTIKGLQLSTDQNVFTKTGEYSSLILSYNTGVSKIALEVCDFTDEDTSIEYFLRTWPSNNENLAQTYGINPLNKPPNSNPYAFIFNHSKNKNNITNSFRISESNLSTELLPPGNYNYFYETSKDYEVLNQKIILPAANIGDLNCFANLRELNSNKTCFYEIKNGYGYCWVYIENSYINDTLNVGNSGLEIIGLEKTNNIIKLSKTGWYQCKFPLGSYQEKGKVFESLAELEAVDNLYPYNVKYMIEGIDSLNLYNYKGFQKQAQYKLTANPLLGNLKLNEYHLSFTAQWYTLFTLKDNDYNNLYIEYPSYETETSYSGQLIAKFKTADPKKTPILSSYKIKMG